MCIRDRATAADIMMRKGNPYIGRLYTGLKGPKRTVLGFEFAGEVVETGSAVTLFKTGDKVFGGTTTPVSYTHLDVYKRQYWPCGSRNSRH